VNASIDAFTVDFCWPASWLIVEVDGFHSHGTRAAFEADRERDAHLAALGFTVIRLTWRQLTSRPAEVAARFRRVLRARSG
jgi:very-short-patch-repair endonuclease